MAKLTRICKNCIDFTKPGFCEFSGQPTQPNDTCSDFEVKHNK